MLSNKPIPVPKLPASQSQIVEALAQQLIAKFQTGILSKIEIVWPCEAAIQIPEDNCPNIPTANIRGFSQEIAEAEAI